MSRPLAFAVLSCFAWSINAQSDYRVGENETVLRGDLFSIEETRDGQSMLGGLFYSCGTQVLKISNVKVIAGVALPDQIVATAPLSEFCSSRFDLDLTGPSVLAGIRHGDDSLTVDWITYVFPDLSLEHGNEMTGPDVIQWTKELEDRYPTLEKRYRCDDLESEDQEYEEQITEVPLVDTPMCYHVSFDEFSRALNE